MLAHMHLSTSCRPWERRAVLNILQGFRGVEAEACAAWLHALPHVEEDSAA
jgi:hypothetical protein